ncbi:hypothetical protein SAMN04487972_11443 [Paracoccus halophilus]|uniref:2,4-dihydroxyhept-2-ene-1,7-dioic acid aldolase n=1 Tax=Paracoccus halophilus TaxID=376733 RepID=A0A099F117_9RHOB|nr:DUF2218 domain-containing protein [Paracoccus halophilus]KGJ04134.1 2,4-dihydroxyhept-2-ene-1,7-dioic acid aldolase [Paracoccus halophilus]SFA55845.1 hypothetical protein SAMN04487972_11443 [Paracoccus halophilus]
MSQTLVTSRCRLATAHGSRYLQQLCKHWAHKFQVEFDAERGRIVLPEDRELLMQAGPDALELQASAPAATLEPFLKVIDSHIIRFAFREELVFDWQPA